MNRSRAAAATVLASLLVLAGCTEPKVRQPRPSSSGTAAPSAGTSTPGLDPSAPGNDFDATEGTDPALAAFYSQEPTWESCTGSGNLECAEVLVPMNYADPNGETITIAVNRNQTAGPGAPTLLLNPGGPGGSGTEMAEYAPFLFTGVTDTYNVAGFDPRGVETSSAIDCVTDPELDAWLTKDADISTDEGLQAYVEEFRGFAQDCVDNTGPLLEFVDTDSVARDLDILRAVVSQTEQLDYVGFSYGTFLGAVYADLFTERVGSFVFDAAVDPALSLAELALGQAQGFDRAITAFMEDCLAGSSCFHQGSVDEGLAKISQLFDVAFATSLPTSDANRPLTSSLALTGVITAMYTTLYWSALNTALDEAVNRGTGTALLALADTGNSRNPDGTFDGNGSEVIMAVNCLDYPVEGTLEDWRAAAEQMNVDYPTFGDAMAYSEVTCSNWPYQSSRVREQISASGSSPILVVGTTRDPATPYEWSVSLAEQLENGHLLTLDGDGHTSYGMNSCITRHVDEFLLTGTIPAAGTTC
nr:alpha/beta fold hydrolase [Actinomycetales bacterium]